MIFTRKKHIDSNINLSIDGKSICEVQKTKLLGLIIDKNSHGKSILLLLQEKYLEGWVWRSKRETFLIKRV